MYLLSVHPWIWYEHYFLKKIHIQFEYNTPILSTKELSASNPLLVRPMFLSFPVQAISLYLRTNFLFPPSVQAILWWRPSCWTTPKHSVLWASNQRDLSCPARPTTSTDLMWVTVIIIRGIALGEDCALGEVNWGCNLG